nr:hypothetical protein [uncultured Holophaga sp.]
MRIKTQDIKACQLIQEIAGGHLFHIEDGYRIQWEVSSFTMFEDLVRLGITPNKTFTASLNWDVIPSHLHGAVLAGLIDGDGHLRFNQEARRAAIIIVTASPILRDQLLERFPFFKLRVQEPCAYRKSHHYQVLVESNRQLLKELIGLVYDPLPFTILDRKQVVLDQIRAYLSTQDEYQQQMAEVPRLKASGLTIDQIAKLMGTSRRPILECLKREGIDSRQQTFSPQDIEEMKRLAEDGMTVLQIHQAIGKGTKQAIRYHLQQMGCLGKTPKPVTRHPQAEEIVHLHGEGLPGYRIAEQLGLTARMVCAVLTQEGIKLRKGSPQKLTDEVLSWVERQFTLGRTQRVIAEELSVSETLLRTRRKGKGSGGA